MKNSRNEYFKLGLFFSVIALVLILVKSISGLAWPLLLSIVAFFTLKPLLQLFERTNLNRTVSIILLFVIIGFTISFATKLLADNLKTEISVFEKEFPKYSSSILESLTQKEQIYERKFRFLGHINLSKKLSTSFQEAGQNLIVKLPQVASDLLSLLLLVPIFTFFMLKDGETLHKKLLQLVPNKYFETSFGITHQILTKTGNYISAKVIEALILGALVTIGLAFLKVDYFILLGIFAGVTNIIPYFGPILGAIPAILLAVISPGQEQLLAISIVYLTANAFDFIIVFPLLMSKSVDLHPLIVILAVLAGGNFMGVLGMIIAIPIAAILKVLIAEFYNILYTNGAID